LIIDEASITHWPAGKIEALRRLLHEEYAPQEPRSAFKLIRSLPHGHVAAALGMARTGSAPMVEAASLGASR
jgi:hypothetical protein